MRHLIKRLLKFCLKLVNPPYLILIYHRVTHLESDPQQLAVSPGHFETQVAHLRKNYHILSIDEFRQFVVDGKKPPRRSVVITFDDGYADNLLEAIPILEKYHAQALFYITTSKLGGQQEFWWDDLERIFLVPGDLPVDLSLSGLPILPTGTPAERLKTYNLLHGVIKDMPSSTRDAMITEIANWSRRGHVGRESHRILTRDEVIQLAMSPASVVGAHTHTHPKLSVCTLSDQEQDIRQSQTILEDLIEEKIVHFSYPFGSKSDYTRHTVDICKRIGFDVVAANTQSPVHSWHSRFELPRLLIRDWDVTEFEKHLHSFFHS